MTRQRADMLAGTDTWSRAARRVRDLAAHLAWTPDEEEISLLDVRDLRMLEMSLHDPRSRKMVQRRPHGTGRC